MGGMNLHAGKAGLLGEHGGVGEATDNLSDVRLDHLPRHLEHPRQGTELQRHHRRRHGWLTKAGEHLPAGVVDLQPELRAPAAPSLGPLREVLQLPVAFQQHAARAGQRVAVDYDVAAEDQPSAAVGSSLIQTQQRFGGSMFGIAHILLHRRLAQAVGNSGTVGQLQQVEEVHGTELDR